MLWPYWSSQPQALHPLRGEQLVCGIFRSFFLLLLPAAPQHVLALGSSVALQQVGAQDQGEKKYSKSDLSCHSSYKNILELEDFESNNTNMIL